MNGKEPEFDYSKHLGAAVVHRYRDRPLPWRVCAAVILLGSALFYFVGFSLLKLVF